MCGAAKATVPPLIEFSVRQLVMLHAFNPDTPEAEAGGSLCVPGQPGLQSRDSQGYMEKRCLRKTKMNTEQSKEKGIICLPPLVLSGLEYLVAGHEDLRTGKLIVNMKSFVQHWKPALGRRVLHILKRACV